MPPTQRRATPTHVHSKAPPHTRPYLREVGVLVSGLLELGVKIGLNGLPDGVAVGADDHGPYKCGNGRDWGCGDQERDKECTRWNPRWSSRRGG